MNKKYSILIGKAMKRTAFGMVSCIHGMYSQQKETYLFGIKGIIGLKIDKKWSYNLY